MLKLGEAAFDEVALGATVFVERVFERTGWVVGDDRYGSFVGDFLAEAVAVISGVGHDNVGRQVLDQCISPRAVAHLSGREGEPHRASEASRAPDRACYTGLLTGQGKLLYDCFVMDDGSDRILVDIASVHVRDFLKRLTASPALLRQVLSPCVGRGG